MQTKTKALQVNNVHACMAIKQLLNYLVMYAQPFCKTPETDAARKYLSKCISDIENYLNRYGKQQRKPVRLKAVKKVRRQKKYSSALKIQRVYAHLLDDG